MVAVRRLTKGRVQEILNGRLSDADLRSIGADNVFAVLHDPEHVRRAVVTDALVSRKDRRAEQVDDASDERTAGYVMSTETPAGPFGDVILVKGWDIKARKSHKFLYEHNLNAHLDGLPLGKMRGLTKDLERRGGPALVGEALGIPAGLNSHADLVWRMIDEDFLTDGSVSWHTIEARRPTEDERTERKLREWSSIISKAELVEFSAVAVGADPNAVKIRSERCAELEARLEELVRAGEFDADLVTEFRSELGLAKATTVFSFAGGQTSDTTSNSNEISATAPLERAANPQPDPKVTALESRIATLEARLKRVELDLDSVRAASVEVASLKKSVGLALDVLGVERDARTETETVQPVEASQSPPAELAAGDQSDCPRYISQMSEGDFAEAFGDGIDDLEDEVPVDGEGENNGS